jgi:hypothetical protein
MRTNLCMSERMTRKEIFEIRVREYVESTKLILVNTEIRMIFGFQ